MNRTRLIHTTAFFLALGIIGPVEARQDKPDKQEEKAKPEKQDKQAKPEKQREAKAPKQEQQAKPAPQQEQKSAKQSQQQDRTAEKQPRSESAKHAQQDRPEKQQQVNSQQQPQRQQRAGSSNAPQRTQQAETRQRAQPALRLSERGSGRIPDDRFRSNFGREHHFHIGEPVLVGGYSRFQYGGFWFGFVEPWPDGWYYTDDVYIDYEDGGYYMYDPYYPGVRFAISVVI